MQLIKSISGSSGCLCLFRDFYPVFKRKLFLLNLVKVEISIEEKGIPLLLSY